MRALERTSGTGPGAEDGARGAAPAATGRPGGPLRIAIVLPDLRGGGAERLHLALAEQWLRLGHEVELVLLADRGPLRAILPAGATVFEVGSPRLRAAVLPLRRYLRRRRPDLTVAAMWPLTVVATLAWTLAARPGRLFLSDHNQLSVAALRELRAPGWLLRGTIRWVYPRASGVIAVSQGVKDDLRRLGRLPEGAVQVVHNPAAVDAPAAPPDPALRQRLWGRAGGLNVLAVGTLKAQKDHETLLRAAALLPPALDARVAILGDGELRDRLLAVRAELGLDGAVLLPGFVLDPRDWFRTADLFVLSSAWEGFANVIVEALSFGVPVVSTDCASGPAEILAGGRHGTLVPVGDPRALAAAVAAPSSRAFDRAALVARSRDFTPERIAARYLEVMGS